MTRKIVLTGLLALPPRRPLKAWTIGPRKRYTTLSVVTHSEEKGHDASI